MTIKENHEHNDTQLSTDARELVVHGDNNTHVHRTSYVPVAKNMERKYNKGTYDHGQAIKAWGHHADRVAQSYAQQYGQVGGQKWHEMFPLKTRRAAAKHWADKHHEEMAIGNFHESEVDHAAEIVWAALSGKPVDASTNMAAALVERSKELVEDKRIDISGKFIQAWVNEQDYKLNPKKKGMWKGWSKADIEKAKTSAKKDGNVTREREANFALLAKSHWNKG